MFQVTVKLENLGIQVYNEDDRIRIRQGLGGGDISFPKDLAQNVIDAVLVVDWAINRRRMTERRKEVKNNG